MAKYGADFSIADLCPVYLKYICEHCGKESNVFTISVSHTARMHTCDPYRTKLSGRQKVWHPGNGPSVPACFRPGSLVI